MNALVSALVYNWLDRLVFVCDRPDAITLGGLLSAASFPHSILAHIVEHVEPIKCCQRYEHPLGAHLAVHGIGRVVRGRSQLSETGAIEFVDIEVELADLEGAVQTVVEKLEQLGAPFGASIRFGPDSNRSPVPFGKREQLALYLDTTRVPDAFYDALDSNPWYEQLAEVAKLHAGGEARSVWPGPVETAIHFVVAEADPLAETIGALRDTLPILQNARLVRRYSDGRPPSEARLP